VRDDDVVSAENETVVSKTTSTVTKNTERAKKVLAESVVTGGAARLAGLLLDEKWKESVDHVVKRCAIVAIRLDCFRCRAEESRTKKL